MSDYYYFTPTPITNDNPSFTIDSLDGESPLPSPEDIVPSVSTLRGDSKSSGGTTFSGFNQQSSDAQSDTRSVAPMGDTPEAFKVSSL